MIGSTCIAPPCSFVACRVLEAPFAGNLIAHLSNADRLADYYYESVTRHCFSTKMVAQLPQSYRSVAARLPFPSVLLLFLFLCKKGFSACSRNYSSPGTSFFREDEFFAALALQENPRNRYDANRLRTDMHSFASTSPRS
jgi:hypothetical protein